MNKLLLLLDVAWSERLGWTILHSLWQIAVVSAVYALGTLWLRRSSASARYVLGCVSLAAMIGLPLATFALLDNPRSQTTAIVASGADPTESESNDLPEAAVPVEAQLNVTHPTANVCVESGLPLWSERVEPFLPWVSVGWVLGVVLFSVRPLLGLVTVRRLRSRGLSPPSSKLAQLAGGLVVRLHMRQSVQFAQSTLVQVPTVLGYLRPIVLLPASALTGLSTQQLELILAHELAHVRRHDYLVNLLQTGIETILFYHPGTWWVSAQVRKDREHCCDDVAVELCGSRGTYVRALLAMEQQRALAPLVLAASGGSLVERARRLMSPTASETGLQRATAWLAGLLPLAVVAVLLLLGSSFAVNGSGQDTAIQGEQSADRDATLQTKPANQPVVAVDFYVAESNPAPGLKKAEVAGSDSGPIYLHKETVLTRKDIDQAHVVTGGANSPEIDIVFTKAGRDKISKASGENLGKRLAIVVDGKVISAPKIVSRIESSARITGRFTEGEADKLAKSIQDAPRPTATVNPAPSDQQSDEVAQEESKPLRVKTAKVKRDSFERTIKLQMYMVAFGQISIPVRNAGIVANAPIEIGDRVKAGEVLAEMDVPDIATEIVEKEAMLAQTRADEEHAKVAILAAEVAVQSKGAELTQSEADVKRAIAVEEFKKQQYARIKKLFDLKSVEERLVDEKNEQLQIAEAEKRAATAKCEATKATLAGSKVEVELARTSRESAAARVAAAQAELKRIKSTTEEAFRLIRSPIDGVVLEKNIEPGSSIKPGSEKPLFRLAGTSQITAVVHIPEVFALAVNRGDVATVELDALVGQQPFAAKISRLAYDLDPKQRTRHAEILLPNTEGQLKPGMFGTATVVIGKVQEALSVPASALFNVSRNGTEATCVRIVDGRTVQTPLKLGLNNGDQAEILEGLTVGDVVVVGLQKAPADGQVVEMISAPQDDE